MFDVPGVERVWCCSACSAYRFIFRKKSSEIGFRSVHLPRGKRMSQKENERGGCLWVMIRGTRCDTCLFFCQHGSLWKGEGDIYGRVCSVISGRMWGRLRCGLYILLSLPLVSLKSARSAWELAKIPSYPQLSIADQSCCIYSWRFVALPPSPFKTRGRVQDRARNWGCRKRVEVLWRRVLVVRVSFWTARRGLQSWRHT